MRTTSIRSKAQAFTLLEVLVASAIMGLVLFVLVSTANTTLAIWRDTRDKIAVDREGRTGLGILEWDLKNIVQPADIAIRPNLATNTNAAVPLRFITRLPSDYQKDPETDLGDICFVEYRFDYNALRRAFVSSEDTLAALRNNQFPLVQASDFELVATNVWQFKVWGYHSDAKEIEYPEKGGPQENPAEALRTIEYRLETVEPRLFKLYNENSQLADAMKSKSRKYFESMRAISPPPAQINPPAPPPGP